MPRLPVAAAVTTALAALGLAWSAGCSVVSLDELQGGTGGGGAGEGGGALASSGVTTSTGAGATTTTATAAGGGGGGAPCAEGTGDCDGDGACEPLAADPLHCGWCGHDCLGGNCLEGKCQPVVVWEGDVVDGRATGVTVDEDAVYFCASGGVRRLPKTGGEPLILDAGGSCTRIAIAGPHAYYSRGGLVRVPRTGGDAERLTTPTMVNGSGMAVDDDHGYVVISGWDAPYPRSLVRVTRDGSSEDILPLDDETTFGVVVHPDGIYVGGDDGLYRVDHATFTRDPEPVSAEVAPSLLLHDDVIYFLGAGLWSVDLASGQESLLRAEMSKGQVATDGTALYVTLFDLGTLWRVSFDGAEAELIADLGPGIDVPAIDDTAIYVSHYEQQRLYRIAK